MGKSIRLYFHYVSVVLLGAMQYKASFFLGMTGMCLLSVNGFLGVYFLLTRFHKVGGYTYGEVLLCYALMLMGFSLAQCFARGFESFSMLVRSGEFDRIMVRPRSPVLQVLGSRFELNRIGRIVFAALMFCYGVRHSGVLWTAGKMITVFFMLAGTVFLFAGLCMLEASLCFFTVGEVSFFNVLVYGGSEHGKYPVDIYGRRMLKFCTYAVPFALVQYYPLQYVLGRTDAWRYAFYPFGIAVFLAFCYGVWRVGLRHYQSAGS